MLMEGVVGPQTAPVPQSLGAGDEFELDSMGPTTGIPGLGSIGGPQQPTPGLPVGMPGGSLGGPPPKLGPSKPAGPGLGGLVGGPGGLPGASIGGNVNPLGPLGPSAPGGTPATPGGNVGTGTAVPPALGTPGAPPGSVPPSLPSIGGLPGNPALPGLGGDPNNLASTAMDILRRNADPTGTQNAFQKYLSTIVSPAILNQMTAAGMGRSGAETEALALAGAQMAPQVDASQRQGMNNWAQGLMSLWGPLYSRFANPPGSFGGGGGGGGSSSGGGGGLRFPIGSGSGSGTGGQMSPLMQGLLGLAGQIAPGAISGIGGFIKDWLTGGSTPGGQESIERDPPQPEYDFGGGGGGGGNEFGEGDPYEGENY